MLYDFGAFSMKMLYTLTVSVLVFAEGFSMVTSSHSGVEDGSVPLSMWLKQQQVPTEADNVYFSS